MDKSSLTIAGVGGGSRCCFLIELIFSPNVYTLINSLSLCNLIKVTIKPNIITKGIITVIKFGIKNIDKYRIVIISTWIKLVNEINLVNCRSQAIDKNIKNIKKQPFAISRNIYLWIFGIIKYSSNFYLIYNNKYMKCRQNYSSKLIKIFKYWSKGTYNG